MVNRATLEVIRSYLHALLADGIPVTRAILFGSYATGTQTESSDIDLLLISPAFDGDGDQYIGRIWALTKVVDYKIEPVVVGEQRFEVDESSPLLEAVRQEGIEVAFQ